MTDASAPFRASYVGARAFLFRRGLYGLLAFDAWLMMVEHGGRYGAGGFNVAHFAWLDALLPLPTPALYVGLLIGIGLSSLAMALIPVGRASKCFLAFAYTFAWAISLHDSYQHHYLLSWLLLWAAFVPEVSLQDLREAPGSMLRSAALGMSAVTCAIVYAFTAVAKSSPEWRSGHVLMRLSRSVAPGSPQPGVLDPIRDGIVALLRVDAQTAFRLLASSVILLQCCVALGYLAVPGRDAARGRLRPLLCSLALACVFAFHVGAEMTGVFRIGWFSYYMLGIGFSLLAPTRWVAAAARTLDVLARGLSAGLAHLVKQLPRRPGAGAWLAGAVCVGAGFVGLGAWLDLPGALPACLGVGFWGALACVRAQPERARTLLFAGGISAACCAVALTQTEVRFDFYRLWAGEVARLGALEEALALYRKAEYYAPPGKSRAQRIHELERALAGPSRAPEGILRGDQEDAWSPSPRSSSPQAPR